MRRSGMADDLAPEEVRALRIDVPSQLPNIRVILEETKDARNVGSVARAIKGMGISELWLVNPLCDWRNSQEARQLASNSRDVLAAAREVTTLDEAVGDVHLLVGTTHRRRERRMAQPVTMREAAAEIARTAIDHRVALYFGREDFGISNASLSRCHLAASIPMAVRNPSLNLAQAVQIAVYEVFIACAGERSPVSYRLATDQDRRALLYRLQVLLRMVEFEPLNDDWDTIRVPLERVLGRTRLESRDVAVMTMLCHDLEEFLKRKGIVPRE